MNRCAACLQQEYEQLAGELRMEYMRRCAQLLERSRLRARVAQLLEQQKQARPISAAPPKPRR